MTEWVCIRNTELSETPYGGQIALYPHCPKKTESTSTDTALFTVKTPPARAARRLTLFGAPLEPRYR